MVRKKLFLSIGFCICVIIVFFGVRDVAINVISKYWGKKVVGKVIRVPESCDKYNHITVNYESEEFEVSISRSNCSESKYFAGQNVELIHHNGFRKLVWPHSKPEILIFIVFIFFVIGFYKLIKM